MDQVGLDLFVLLEAQVALTIRLMAPELTPSSLVMTLMLTGGSHPARMQMIISLSDLFLSLCSP